jgi:histidine triad (HIT) family protein
MATVENCIFCKIVRREIQADEVARDAHVVAFRDTNPQAPVHILVVPTEHAEHLSDFTSSATDERAARLLATASALGRQYGSDGYRVVINEGPDGGQTVFHLHAHVLAGRPMHWPPG